MPFITIRNNAFPNLVFGDATQVMPWDHGTIYSLRLKSTFLRITQRGLQYSMSSTAPIMANGIWKSASCTPTHDGLCATSKSDGGMVWFPDTKVDIPDNFALIPENSYLVDFANGTACTSSSTGRSVTMFDERYEVSLCDLLDSNLDVVYIDENIYWRQDKTELWLYLLISVVSIYLVSCVSENIVASVNNNSNSDIGHQKYSIYLTLLLIFYVIYAENTVSLLLTKEDIDLCLHLVIYVVVQGIVLQFKAPHELYGSRISLLTACIALLTLRVHYSFDNPYMIVLSIMFGTRSFFKFLAAESNGSTYMESAIMVLDIFTLSSLLDNGLMANSEDQFSGNAMQVILILVCLLTAAQAFIYKAQCTEDLTCQ